MKKYTIKAYEEGGVIKIFNHIKEKCVSKSQPLKLREIKTK